MIKLRVKVKPNSRTSKLDKPGDNGLWLARIKAPPVGGKANLELRRLVSEYYNCPLNRVTIKHGETSRIKMLLINEE